MFLTKLEHTSFWWASSIAQFFCDFQPFSNTFLHRPCSLKFKIQMSEFFKVFHETGSLQAILLVLISFSGIWNPGFNPWNIKEEDQVGCKDGYWF